MNIKADKNSLFEFVPSGCRRASSIPGIIRFLRHQRRHQRRPGGVRTQWTLQAGQPRLRREDPQRLQRPIHQTGTKTCSDISDDCYWNNLSFLSEICIFCSDDLIVSIWSIVHYW